MNTTPEVLFCNCGLVLLKDFSNPEKYFCNNGHKAILETVVVEHVETGMLVDLKSCPFRKEHSVIDIEYDTVTNIVVEFWDCVTITYKNIDAVRYKTGTVLKVLEVTW